MSDVISGYNAQISNNFKFGPGMAFPKFDPKPTERPTLASAFLDGKLKPPVDSSSGGATSDEKDCLRTQSKLLSEFTRILDKQTDISIRDLIAMKLVLLDEQNSANELWEEVKRSVDDFGENCDESSEDFDKKVEQFFDTSSEILAKFNKKKQIEEFVRQNEHVSMTSSETAWLIKDNALRIEKIQKSIKEHNTPAHAGQKDARIDEVFHNLVSTIHKMPLNANEMGELDGYIEQTARQPYDTVFKCELICRRLFATMSKWESEKKSRKSKSPVVDSSSFLLSDLDDSNLRDLDGELRETRIRTAIDAPAVFHLESWSSASDPLFAGSMISSSDSQGVKTLSSSSDGSLPTVVSLQPRSLEPYSIASNDPHSSTASLSYSNISFTDMVEDILHTAKEAVETQATNLVDALKNSASSMITAVSGSTDNISDTHQHSVSH